MGKNITLNRRGVVTATAPGNIPVVPLQPPPRNPLQAKLDDAAAKITSLESNMGRAQTHLSRLVEENIQLKQAKDALSIELANTKRLLVVLEAEAAKAKVVEKPKAEAKPQVKEAAVIELKKAKEEKPADLFDLAPPPAVKPQADKPKEDKKVDKKTSKRPKR
jgi:regulator of replication initiation timing